MLSTSYASTWRAYCDFFKHSLVCIDRSEDVGVIVYSYNEITKNISGQLLERWSEREKWCLDKLTLNGNLPLDIIEAIEVSKILYEKKKDAVLEISGNRYYKINKDSSSTFPTRLVSKGGVYSYNNDSLENNAQLLQKAGFVEHENCVPYLAKSQGTKTSKADAELRKVEIFDVRIIPSADKTKNKQLKEELTDRIKKVAEDIQKERKPLIDKLQQKNREFIRIRDFKSKFHRLNTIPMKDLKQGSYTVKLAKRLATRFGISYKLLIEGETGDYTTWCNKGLINDLSKLEEDDNVQKDGGFLSLENQPLGMLEITGKGTNVYGKVTVYTRFMLNLIENAKKVSPTPVINPEPVVEIPTIPRENLLPYRDYENVTVLPVGSVHKIEGIGHIAHYGTPRLVLKINENIYQAGQDLEEKEGQIAPACSIKIEKIRVNRDRHVKYAICTIYENGDWTALVNYCKTPILSRFNGSTNVVDVRTVNVKGVKRKLLLTDTGEIYKLKKSKLEERLKSGQFYRL